MNEEIKTTTTGGDDAGEQKAPQAEAKQDDLTEKLRASIAESNAKLREGIAAIGECRGILHLETPILARDKEIQELAYDFTQMTGLEYTEAMDVGNNGATQIYGISHKQCLNLFAVAAAKETEDLDRQDIVSRIKGTDAAIAIEAAKSFFTGSIRAGQKRISKRS